MKTPLAAALVLLAVDAAAFTGPAAAAEPARCTSRPVIVGVNVQGTTDYDRVRAAQLGWVRITIRWSAVNSSPGVWQLAEVDREVAAARARGVEVLAILSHTPEWAGGGPHGTVPPADLEPWRELVERVARRYRGRIAAYEIWNEPDVSDLGPGIGWQRDLDVEPRYVDLLHAAATILRAEAPGTLIVAPALSSASTSRTAQLCRQLETTRCRRRRRRWRRSRSGSPNSAGRAARSARRASASTSSRR